MSAHLLVTNDFPPKVGGIQVYLWELWRRLDPDRYRVLTASSHPEAPAFDARQAARGIRIERSALPVLLPTPLVRRRVDAAVAAAGAKLVVIDPALPLGLIGPALGVPYAVVLHGAEVTVAARLPGTRQALAHVLRRASLVVCAGRYPEAEARRIMGRQMPPTVVVPPGVDTERFVPLAAPERRARRLEHGLPPDGTLVLSVSRLVPRKGMDVLVDATAALRTAFGDLSVAIAGSGRDEARLRRRAEVSGAPVRFLGRVSDDELPGLYAAADLFVMDCRNRWVGLEQEGFGMVFLEAAAAGVAQIAGRSGGADEAVEDGVTGLVVDDPADPGALARAMRGLLADPGRRAEMGRAARERAERSFQHDLLARRLGEALEDVGG